MNGLAVIGGSLRVPSGVNEPFLGANTYAGSTFHAFRSQIGAATIKAFGATHTDVVPEQRDIGLSDGSIDGYENTLPFHAGRPAMARHVTANVALWPGIGVLVVSPDTLARLDNEEQDWLQTGAANTAAASIDLIDDDREVIREICDLGGSVYEASESDTASLREAVQTVFDQLMRDSTTAAFMEEINEISESIEPEPIVIPDGCAGEAVTGDPRLPDGTYTTEALTVEDAPAALQARGIEIDEAVAGVIDAELGEGTYTVSIVLDDGRFIQSLAKDGGRPKSGPAAPTRYSMTRPWRCSKPVAARLQSTSASTGMHSTSVWDSKMKTFRPSAPWTYSIALESWSTRAGRSSWMVERVARADAVVGGSGSYAWVVW